VEEYPQGEVVFEFQIIDFLEGPLHCSGAPPQKGDLYKKG